MPQAPARRSARGRDSDPGYANRRRAEAVLCRAAKAEGFAEASSVPISNFHFPILSRERLPAFLLCRYPRTVFDLPYSPTKDRYFFSNHCGGQSYQSGHGAAQILISETPLARLPGLFL